MKLLLFKLINFLIGMSREAKTISQMVVDFFVLTFTFWLALSIRDNIFYLPTPETLLLIILGPFIALPIFYYFGLYNSIIRYGIAKSFLSTIISAVSLYTLFWFVIVVSVGIVEKPYDFLFINWLVSIFFIGAIRFMAREILASKSNDNNVVIYGAGSAGIELESALTHNPNINVIRFIDNNPKIIGTYISGIKVEHPKHLERLITEKELKEVYIAIPSLSRQEKTDLINGLKIYPLIIKSIPSLSDLIEGRVSISNLRKIKIEDLLNRKAVKPDQDLLLKNIEGKCILVTGAGGSIGSELCRQIIKLDPKLLILFDISESSLYLIESELRELNTGIRILAMIGNVTRRNRLDFILINYKVDTIYHAAAYKHVPLVEKNTIPGIRCNIFGTLTCLESAIDCNVKNFVFISTDKAVRPTNVMGATKRFAELILQAYSKRNLLDLHNSNIRISMVRFGNVLGSSGSVVPLFRRQIENGGPVTVTDPKIIRYFMTIEEASQLVIQAGAMGSEGEVFLLDMGEPIHVLDLAKDMIRLSGMTIKDQANPNGDIEIIFTGLRPGEKLYEELLIGKESDRTQHEKIMKTTEETIEYEDLQRCLLDLNIAINESNFKKIREIFLNTVSGYNPSS
jgi:UDP-N-acetylglucosamine 4,6-dehydratase